MSVADQRRYETGVSLNVYQCGFCQGWHMGSAENRED